MKYKSGFSKYNYFIFLLPLLTVFCITLLTNSNSCIPFIIGGGISIFLFILIFIGYITTYYKIENDYLIISMFYYKTKIKISDITSIHYSNSFIKTNLYKPGFHQKGLEILYKNYNDIYISPINKELFIQELKNQNQTIEIKTE